MNEPQANDFELQDEEAIENEGASEENASPNDEISNLKNELDVLRAELREREERERAQSRFFSEIAEFEQYFPEVDLHSIPDEIWERVKNGASLASSYALFLRRKDLEKKKVGDFNEKNRRMSAGSLISGEGERYFSPSEVKKMTPAQVRSHYDDIVASMKHWN
ncbi:MAG: hypothetical protein IKA84_04430 [Clostridia bacterium]|nr:hypothetical protein [Clostridia bacterium]